MANIGYIRVSSNKQTLEHQRFEIENFALKDAIKKLSQKEKQILLMRYYLGKTQIEVSSEVGISQAQVSRLEKEAINSMRKDVL